MFFMPADLLSLFLFSIFSLVMLGVILYSFYKAKAQKWDYIFLASYLCCFSGIVISGLPRDAFIPFGPILFSSVFVYVLFFLRSSLSRALVEKFSLTSFVGFQVFRLPLELLLHHWANHGTIPWVSRFRWIAWSTQLVGLALLINVVRVVVMSSPFPFSWQLENPLQLVMYFPYALIGPLFVGVALAGHLLTFRKLLHKP